MVRAIVVIDDISRNFLFVVLSDHRDLEHITTGGTILRIIISCLDDELACLANCLFLKDTGTVAQRLGSTGVHEERVLLPSSSQIS
jgi:hypothetical protein